MRPQTFGFFFPLDAGLRRRRHLPRDEEFLAGVKFVRLQSVGVLDLGGRDLIGIGDGAEGISLRHRVLVVLLDGGLGRLRGGHLHRLRRRHLAERGEFLRNLLDDRLAVLLARRVELLDQALETGDLLLERIVLRF